MAMTLITTNTESGDSTSSFTSSIDSTYKLYVFKFIDINAADDDVHFQFQTSTNGGSSYGMTITSTHFQAHHKEDDSEALLEYQSDMDLAQATSGCRIAFGLGNDADQSCAGTLWLFNPSSTTYVKHFYSTFSNNFRLDAAYNSFVGGYINSTSDVDAIQFAMSSGNFDGTIKMYGVG